MSFTVTILGSGAAVPTSRRNPSAQYVQCANRHVLIDCGEGTQIQLRRNSIKFQRIEYVLISHLHGDHFFGLIGLLSTMHLMGRVRPIHIFGPKGLKEIIELQFKASGGRIAYDVNIEEIEPNFDGILFEDQKIKISCFPLNHKIPTSGFVIEEKEKERSLLVELAQADGVKIENYHKLKQGFDVEQDGVTLRSEKYTRASDGAKRYAYCSDTMYQERTIEFVKGVDLLYHEATFIEALRDRAGATKHSTAKDAAKIALAADVKTLLMGHISARYDTGEVHLREAKTIFENSEVVEDGMVYKIS